MLKRVVCAAVLWAVAVGVALPGFADEDKELEMIASMFRAKDPSGMLEWLKKGFVDIDEDEIGRARKTCAMLEKYARPTTLANDGDGTTSALIEWFEQKADSLIERAPKKPSAYRAKAHVLSARVKCEIAAVRFKGPGPWEECATLCLKAAELSKTKKAEYAADAAMYYTDWYPHAGDRQEEVQKLALETAKQGLAAHPDNAYLKAALGEIYLAEAKGYLAIKKKGPAKKSLQAALDALQPSGELPKGPKGSTQAGAYNRVLAYALSNKVKVKGEFICTEKKSNDWILRYPRGTGWQYTIGGWAGVWSMSRDTDWGSCEIRLDEYDWNITYVTPDGEAGGANTTGMSRQGAVEWLKNFSKVDKRKKDKKGKLSRNYRKTIGFDIRGLDEDDEPMRVRGWYFKGNSHRKTYELQVIWRGDAPEEDAEIEYILEHMDEREGDK